MSRQGCTQITPEIRSFCERIGLKLNDQQMLAAQAVDGPTLLIAVPGSGKTTVLVTRLGYMIIEKGIDPKQILSMTYTKAATIDMKKRFVSMFGEDIGKDVEFRTINGIAEITIRRYAQMYGRYPFKLITEEKGRAAIIRDILIEMNHGEFPTDNEITEVGTLISYIKNMMLTSEEIVKKNLGIRGSKLRMVDVYEKYQERLRQTKQMDFDDQLVYALSILRKCPKILQMFHEEYRYICVDEAQDTSKIQHTIIKLLAQQNNNIFMVGDEDQSIYGFRAAYPKALTDFKTDYPDPLVLFMEKNYRSSQSIVKTASAFIVKNKDRYNKRFIATRNIGAKPQVINVIRRDHQYDHIQEAAQNMQATTAVLYRDNDCVIPLIDQMLRENIPFNVRQVKNTFFTNKVVLDILAFIKLAINPFDTDSFMKIYYKSDFKCNKQIAINICKYANRHRIRIIDAVYEYASNASKFYRLIQRIGKAKPSDAIEIIMDEGYEDYIRRNNLEKGKADILQSIARQTYTNEEFLNRIDELNLMFTENSFPNQDHNGIILSTIHSSKGLEYDTVYLLDIYDGILPVMPESPYMSDEEQETYQEERRLFYVATTRAKNHLYLFKIQNKKSSFLEEIAYYTEAKKSTYGTVKPIIISNNIGYNLEKAFKKKAKQKSAPHTNAKPRKP